MDRPPHRPVRPAADGARLGTVSRRTAIAQLAALGLAASGLGLPSREVAAAERTTLWAWLARPQRLAAAGQYDVTVEYAVDFSQRHLSDLRAGSVFYLECRFWDYDSTSSDDVIYAWHYANRDLPRDSARRAPALQITAQTLRSGPRVTGTFRKRMAWTWLDQDDFGSEAFYAGLHLVDAQTYQDVPGVSAWHSNHQTLRVPL